MQNRYGYEIAEVSLKWCWLVVIIPQKPRENSHRQCSHPRYRSSSQPVDSPSTCFEAALSATQTPDTRVRLSAPPHFRQAGAEEERLLLKRQTKRVVSHSSRPSLQRGTRFRSFAIICATIMYREIMCTEIIERSKWKRHPEIKVCGWSFSFSFVTKINFRTVAMKLSPLAEPEPMAGGTFLFSSSLLTCDSCNFLADSLGWACEKLKLHRSICWGKFERTLRCAIGCVISGLIGQNFSFFNKQFENFEKSFINLW